MNEKRGAYNMPLLPAVTAAGAAAAATVAPTATHHTHLYQPSCLRFRTGTTVMGTVLIFGTLQHTATHTEGIMGTQGFIIVPLSLVFLFQTTLFIIFYHFLFFVSQCDRTKYGLISHAYIFAFHHQPPSSHSHSNPTSKHCKWPF